jgi:putative two-component system response regulator
VKNNTEHSSFLMNLTILVVDDHEDILEILKNFILMHGGIAHTTSKFGQVQHLVETHQFDAAVIDILLDGGGSGFELVDKISQIDPELTVILMTGKSIENMVHEIIKKNIYAVTVKPFNMLSLGLLLLQASRNTRNLRRNRYISTNLRGKINKIQLERDKIFLNTLLSLSNALEQKDGYTRNHSEVVGDLSEKIGLEYSTNEEFIEDVGIAGRLHDIGKIGIKDDILFKEGPLTDEEYEIVKKHPEMSYKIIKPVDTKGDISSLILHHHERWNGEGYPHRLKEKGIPAGARILAVSDTFNALLSNRPYRKARDLEFALQVLHDGSAILFDPEIVEIIHKLVRIGRIVL